MLDSGAQVAQAGRGQRRSDRDYERWLGVKPNPRDRMRGGAKNSDEKQVIRGPTQGRDQGPRARKARSAPAGLALAFKETQLPFDILDRHKFRSLESRTSNPKRRLAHSYDHMIASMRDFMQGSRRGRCAFVGG